MKKTIEGWVHKEVTLSDLLKWNRRRHNGPLLHAEYIEEVCKTQEEAGVYFGTRIKKVKITIEFPEI